MKHRVCSRILCSVFARHSTVCQSEILLVLVCCKFTDMAPKKKHKGGSQRKTTSGTYKKKGADVAPDAVNSDNEEAEGEMEEFEGEGEMEGEDAEDEGNA